MLNGKSKWLFLILFLYFILAINYTLNVPIYESPDEPGHFEYIKYLIENRRIPIMSGHKQGVYDELILHPPLYYFLNAVIYAPIQHYDRPAEVVLNEKFGLTNLNKYFHKNEKIEQHIPFYLLRLFSILLGMGTIFFTWKIANEIFPENYLLVIVSTAINAFIPQFIFISSVISNDNLSNLIAAIVVYFNIKLVKESFQARNTIYYLGIALSLAILTKYTIIYLLPFTILCLFVFIKDKKIFFKNVLLLFSIILIISGWYFIRNIIYTKHILGPEYSAVRSLFSCYFIRPFSTVMMVSFLGVFGWMNITMGMFFYRMYLLFIGLGVLGIILYLCDNKNSINNAKKYYWILLFSFLLSLASVVSNNMYGDVYQGRHLFNAISAFAILTAAGNYYFFNWLIDILFCKDKKKYFMKDNSKILLAILIVFSLFGLNIYFINIYIKPAYIGAFI